MELSLWKKLAYFKYHTEELFFNRHYSQIFERNSANFKKFCLFIGFGRTGSSLLGALLNAHPDIAMEHEAFFLRQTEQVERPALRATQRRRYIFLPRTFSPAERAYPLSRSGALGFLIDSARRKQGDKGFKQFGYDYAIPLSGDWPAGGPAIIGEKSGRITGEAINHRGLDWLGELTRAWALNLAFINITRNPFDVLTTLCIREFGEKYGVRTLGARETATLAIEKTPRGEFTQFVEARILAFIEKLSLVQEVTQQLIDGGKYPLKVVHYDELSAKPREVLAELLAFLGVPAGADYLTACASIIKPASVSRHYLGDIWSDKLRGAVMRMVDKHASLQKYTFDA